MIHNLLKVTGVFAFTPLLTTDIFSQNVGIDVATPQQKPDVLGRILRAMAIIKTNPAKHINTCFSNY